MGGGVARALMRDPGPQPRFILAVESSAAGEAADDGFKPGFIFH